MYKNLKNGILALGSMYILGCGSSPQMVNNSNDVQETVRRTHEETVEVTTRTEDEHERTVSTTNGDTTTTDRRLTRHSDENRLRTVDRQEGDVTGASRNITLDLEGLVAGIQNGTLSRNTDDGNVFLDISFSYNGNNFIASLVDFADAMIGGEGNHVCDYFTFKIKRGRNDKNLLWVNFSDMENSMEFRQAPRSASILHYVPVGNVVYRIDFTGGNTQDGSLSSEDIMRMVDTARSRVGPEYR